jgi:hypothetical protein
MTPLELVRLGPLMERTRGRTSVSIGLIDGPVVVDHPELNQLSPPLGRSQLCGLYDIKRLTGGYSDHNVYACNPSDFMRHEHDPTRLDAFRRQDIILAIGRDDSARANNEELSATLWSKGIGNALRIWDGWAHDWLFSEEGYHIDVSHLNAVVRFARFLGAGLCPRISPRGESPPWRGRQLFTVSADRLWVGD